jgi:hypothetical protein
LIDCRMFAHHQQQGPFAPFISLEVNDSRSHQESNVDTCEPTRVHPTDSRSVLDVWLLFVVVVLVSCSLSLLLQRSIIGLWYVVRSF